MGATMQFATIGIRRVIEISDDEGDADRVVAVVRM